MVGYFHHHDTGWAFMLLEELTRRHPDEALFILGLLLKVSAEMPPLREEIFLHAFDLFVRLNFDTYRDELKNLALQNDDLRQWFLNRANEGINGAGGWAAFVDDLRGR